MATQTWQNSAELTTKNNLVFESKEQQAYFYPRSMELVAVFDNDENANDFLHRHLSLSIYLSNLNSGKYKVYDEIVIQRNLQDNVFRIGFAVNNPAPLATYFQVDENMKIMAMFTFPAGKPAGMIASYLVVRGETELPETKSQ